MISLFQKQKMTHFGDADLTPTPLNLSDLQLLTQVSTLFLLYKVYADREIASRSWNHDVTTVEPRHGPNFCFHLYMLLSGQEGFLP